MSKHLSNAKVVAPWWWGGDKGRGGGREGEGGEGVRGEGGGGGREIEGEGEGGREEGGRGGRENRMAFINDDTQVVVGGAFFLFLLHNHFITEKI